MATKTKKQIVCSKCGENQKILMCIGVNNLQNPEIKEKILLETFFDFRCEKCGNLTKVIYPMIFTDPQKNYMIALTPIASQETKLKSNESIRDTVKRQVKNTLELKEKILILDEGLSDLAIEIVKLSVTEYIKENHNVTNVKAYFSKITEYKKLSFALFINGSQKAVYEEFEFELYQKAIETIRTSEFGEANEFLKVGKNLAEYVLEQAKNNT